MALATALLIFLLQILLCIKSVAYTSEYIQYVMEEKVKDVQSEDPKKQISALY